MSGPTNFPPRADAKNLTLSGQRGAGFYRLVAGVELVVNAGGPQQQAVLVPFGGDLQVQDGHVIAHLSPTGNAPTVDAIGNRDLTWTVHFCADLDAARLKALEDIRSNGSLMFTARLSASLVHGYSRLQCESKFFEVRCEVNQSDWARLREQMGAGRTMLVEVPEPDAQRFPESAQAVAHWQQAWRANQRRDPAAAVGDCRLALEALMQALGDRDDAPVNAIYDAEVRALFQNQRAMNKEERLRLVRRAVRVLCHPPHHADTVSAGIAWDRDDGEFVLAVVSALLARYIERTP